MADKDTVTQQNQPERGNNKAFKKEVNLLRVLLIFFIVLAGVAFLVHQQTKNYYKKRFDNNVASIEKKYSKKLAFTEQKIHSVYRIIDTNTLQQSFNEIDSSLDRIDSSLQARGLGSIKAGGRSLEREIDHSNNPKQVVSYYENYTKNAEKKLLFLPLGIPSWAPKSSGYGLRHDPIFPDSVMMHAGLDFAGNMGDSVKCTADGYVRFAGYNGGYGNCIIIRHDQQYETLYGHLSKILVTAGTKVSAGTLIGLMGSTGRSTGSHLHYEVIKNGVRVNPERYLKLF